MENLTDTLKTLLINWRLSKDAMLNFDEMYIKKLEEFVVSE